MSEVDALFRLVQAAPPRSAEIVKRFTLRRTSLEELATLYAVTPALARILVLRALVDVEGGPRVPAPDEPELAAAVFDGAPGDSRATALRSLIEKLQSHAEPLTQKLRVAAEEFEKSPDRARDEWVRRFAIVLVLALTWYFWRQQENKPKVVLLPRPMLDAGIQQ